MGEILLRAVREEDLPVLYEHQREPEGLAVANFAPRDRDAFTAHWSKILADPTVLSSAILHDGELAGNVVSFQMGELRLLGYWLGSAFWGRGIATRAVSAFLRIERTRPLHAYVFKRNLGSIRVLEKSGFRRSGDDGSSDYIYRLIEPSPEF